MAAGGSSRGLFYGITQNEHKELVDSTDKFRESVVRIIKEERDAVVQTGTAFLVYSGDNKSLFLTCEHNFSKVISGDFIRLYEGEKKNYPVAQILRRSEKHDLLLFSVDSVPKRKSLEFSTEQVKKDDRVVVLGYVSPSLTNAQGYVNELVLVNDPGAFAGVVVGEPLKDDANEDHEKIWITCETTKGVSGSPLFKNSKVIGVLLATDKELREAVSANTVLQVLRGWHGLGKDDENTIEELFKLAHDTFKP